MTELFFWSVRAAPPVAAVYDCRELEDASCSHRHTATEPARHRAPPEKKMTLATHASTPPKKIHSSQIFIELLADFDI
jgi:hypothetical protein